MKGKVKRSAQKPELISARDNMDPLRGEGVSDAGEALGEWSMDYDQRVTGLIQRVHPGIEFMKETMIFIGFEI